MNQCLGVIKNKQTNKKTMDIRPAEIILSSRTLKHIFHFLKITPNMVANKKKKTKQNVAYRIITLSQAAIFRQRGYGKRSFDCFLSQ